MKFCKNCGMENENDAEYCVHCNSKLGNKIFKEPQEDENKSKTLIGLLMSFFLGLLGLLIGICLYPFGSVERETFIRARLGGYIVITIIFAILMFF